MNQVGVLALFVGNSHDARAPEGVTAILNCANDLDVPAPDGVVRSKCGLIDGNGNRMAAYYSAVLQLAVLMHQNHRVLVHCHEGRSRSVMVALSYMRLWGEVGWDEGLAIIRQTRPEANPHVAHREAYDRMDWGWLRRAVYET